MAAIEISMQNFKDTIDKDGIVVLDWWASWCGPCRAFAPTFEKASEENPDIVFGKINTETEEQLAGVFEIRSIPTLMVFRDRVLLYSEAGGLPAPALGELLGQVRKLDMDEVRREIAEAEAKKPQA
jgi:thioredoxin 1